MPKLLPEGEFTPERLCTECLSDQKCWDRLYWQRHLIKKLKEIGILRDLRVTHYFVHVQIKEAVESYCQRQYYGPILIIVDKHLGPASMLLYEHALNEIELGAW